MSWVTVLLDEVKSSEPQQAHRDHSFREIRCLRGVVQYCRYCGHVPLKNDISRLVTRIGCGYESDTRYKQWRESVSKGRSA